MFDRLWHRHADTDANVQWMCRHVRWQQQSVCGMLARCGQIVDILDQLDVLLCYMRGRHVDTNSHMRGLPRYMYRHRSAGGELLRHAPLHMDRVGKRRQLYVPGDLPTPTSAHV